MLVDWNDGALSFFPEGDSEEKLLDAICDTIKAIGPITLKHGRPWDAIIIPGSGSLEDNSASLRETNNDSDRKNIPS